MSLLPLARLYLNGFPKAGLHFAEQWVSTVLEPELSHTGNWFGTFNGNGWTTSQGNLEHVDAMLASVRSGYYVKGHMGWAPGLADKIKGSGVGVAFVYRDLRDVVVSHAYHVLSDDDEKLKHPGKALYKALPAFEDVLIACIDGIGPYPGIFKRWELYAGWLLEGWVLKLKYEDMINSPRAQAERLARYLYNGSQDNLLIDQVTLLMVQRGRETSKSMTFRRGKTGDWRKEFTPRVKAAFKAADPGWLDKLGYAHGDW